jgi:transposase-like protein
MPGMNKLALETRVQILNLLVEGSSLRSISRVCDVSINTVMVGFWRIAAL